MVPIVHVQCVAVCCSVLQCVAVCCGVLQCMLKGHWRLRYRHGSNSKRVVWCSALQCVAVCCSLM